MKTLNTKQNQNRPPKSTHTFTFSKFLSFIETSQKSPVMCQETTSCLLELFWVQQFDNLIITVTMQNNFCNEGRIIHTSQTWQQSKGDGKMCLSTAWFIQFSICIFIFFCLFEQEWSRNTFYLKSNIHLIITATYVKIVIAWLDI